MDFLEDLLRTITFFIDKLIYGFIPTVYNFIYELANRVIFTQTELDKIAKNIYAIIGVFMLFRLSFVLLMSIVNPDNLTDKEKGFTKMISKIVIAIVMITAIPIGFDLAYQLQSAILKNAIVEKVILGNEISNSELTPEISCKYDVSSSKQKTIYGNEEVQYIKFYFPEGVGYSEKPQLTYLNASNEEETVSQPVTLDSNITKNDFLTTTGAILCPDNFRLSVETIDGTAVYGKIIYSSSEYPKDIFLVNEQIEKMNEKGGVLLARKAFKAFVSCNPNTPSCSSDEETIPELGININQAISQGLPLKGESDFSNLSDSLNSKQDDKYIVKYTPLLSTITGGAVLALLLVLCFDIATRVVKLAFFQVITPVAVIGYIEPGSKIFNQWLQMTIKTFVNLFIRLFAISFVVLILGALGDKISLGDLGDLFLIFGALIFAKEAPKLIADMFGIKDSGFGGMLKNPFKNMAGSGLANKIGGFGLGAAAKLGGYGLSGLGGGIASKTRGGGFLKGASEGMKKSSAKNISMGKGIKGAVGSSLKANPFSNWRSGSNAGASSALGHETTTGALDWAKKSVNRGIENLDENAKTKFENKAVSDYQQSGDEIYSKSFKEALSKVDSAKKGKASASSLAEVYRQKMQKEGHDVAAGPSFPGLTNQQVYDKFTKEVARQDGILTKAKENMDSMKKSGLYDTDFSKKEAIDSYKYRTGNDVSGPSTKQSSGPQSNTSNSSGSTASVGSTNSSGSTSSVGSTNSSGSTSSVGSTNLKSNSEMFTSYQGSYKSDNINYGGDIENKKQRTEFLENQREKEAKIESNELLAREKNILERKHEIENGLRRLEQVSPPDSPLNMEMTKQLNMLEKEYKAIRNEIDQRQSSNNGEN